MNQYLVHHTSTSPRWSVIDFSYSMRHSYAKFVVMCHHVRYVVHASDVALASAPDLRDKYLFFLQVADSNTLGGYTVDDLYAWALAPLLPILRLDTDSLPAPGSRATTLRDVLYAPIMEYTLAAESGRLLLRPKDEDPDTRLMFGAHLPEMMCHTWPTYLPLHIRLDLRDTLDAVPRRVFLPNGAPAFFRLVRRGEGALLSDALLAHGRMRASSSLPPEVRVARLLGLVCVGGGGGDATTVFGMLLTYVDGATMSLARAVEAGGAPARLRRRWSEQVLRTVHSLHQSGLVWGDARPKNVVIDGEGNAWLVGFGGGYAAGWVPKELAGTVDGDLAALKRIIDYTEEGASM